MRVLHRAPAMGRVRRIHFVGVGGVGMGGIAEVLVNLGYEVSGSDMRVNAMTERLAKLGVVIYRGHRAEYAARADVLVTSAAIPTDNPEIAHARERQVPVVARAQMLAELMRFRYGVAVAGTHGKTTTTSLVASLLTEGNLDPTFVIGGRLIGAGTNAKLGESDYLVAEADESDASFLHLNPIVAIVTNVDQDHMETYGGEPERLYQTFVEFLHNLPFYGLAVLCHDDPGVQVVRERVSRPVISYGFNEAADYRAVNVSQRGPRMSFEIMSPGLSGAVPVELNLAGRHNVLNALAAVAVARELDVGYAAIARGLRRFEGIGRRFQIYGEVSIANHQVLLVDDYGHHPREVEATVRAARASWPQRRLVVAFQLHRYSRTRDLFEDFALVLSELDVLLLLDVYAAGEQPIAGADGRALARAIRNRGRVDPVFVTGPQALPKALAGILNDGDVLLLLGAGSIGAVAPRLVAG
ncbi:MAG: UDP-N-acetylmuramate--L-alanine ligase [Gammaproteobacteria bacterium]|nr:UDP-N-acetylmuramate--L-alanine ligase [Gammaproteobacteria bacterium]